MPAGSDFFYALRSSSEGPRRDDLMRMSNNFRFGPEAESKETCVLRHVVSLLREPSWPRSSVELESQHHFAPLSGPCFLLRYYGE